MLLSNSADDIFCCIDINNTQLENKIKMNSGKKTYTQHEVYEVLDGTTVLIFSSKLMKLTRNNNYQHL